MNLTLKVAVVITNDESQTLLVKEQYTKEAGPKWNLVKGTYDNSNETIEECVIREVWEEVGLADLESAQLKKVFHYGTPEQPKILFVFSARYLGKATPTRINNKQDENIVEIKWFSKEELNKLGKEDCMSDYVFNSVRAELGESVTVQRI